MKNIGDSGICDSAEPTELDVAALEAERKECEKEAANIEKSGNGHFLSHPILPHTTIVELINRWKNTGDEAAREKVILHNLRLVMSIAVKYAKAFRLDCDDLFQEGIVGLMKAVDRFDTERQNNLSTYAMWWIKHYIFRYIQNHRSGIRIPVHLQESMRGITGVENNLRHELDRQPTPEEINERCKDTLGISDSFKIQRLIRVNSILSLDCPLMDTSDSATIGDMVPDSNGTYASTSIIAQEYLNQLRVTVKAVETLITTVSGRSGKTPLRDKEIFFMRFGLDGKGKKTLESIGEKYELTRERVRQICERSFQRIARWRPDISRESLEDFARRYEILEEIISRREPA